MLKRPGVLDGAPLGEGDRHEVRPLEACGYERDIPVWFPEEAAGADGTGTEFPPLSPWGRSFPVLFWLICPLWLAGFGA